MGSWLAWGEREAVFFCPKEFLGLSAMGSRELVGGVGDLPLPCAEGLLDSGLIWRQGARALAHAKLEILLSEAVGYV